ncbi:hypothetical protein K438DRAFT_1768830 [Mycena galopus ATCC 62051]|nr:hypothetical protein K438DRAFT_1768830 [Mycena galopus ATCC 62051]
MSSMIPGHTSTSRPPPEKAKSKTSQGAAQLKSSPAVSLKFSGGAGAARAPQGPASPNSSTSKSLTATKSTMSSRARQVTFRLKPSPSIKSSTGAGSVGTFGPPHSLVQPDSSLSLTKSSVVPGNTTVSRPPRETARFKSLSTKSSMIPSNANASGPQTGTRFNSMSGDPAVIPHHPSQFPGSQLTEVAEEAGEEVEAYKVRMGPGELGRAPGSISLHRMLQIPTPVQQWSRHPQSSIISLLHQRTFKDDRPFKRRCTV